MEFLVVRPIVIQITIWRDKMAVSFFSFCAMEMSFRIQQQNPRPHDQKFHTRTQPCAYAVLLMHSHSARSKVEREEVHRTLLLWQGEWTSKIDKPKLVFYNLIWHCERVKRWKQSCNGVKWIEYNGDVPVACERHARPSDKITMSIDILIVKCLLLFNCIPILKDARGSI